MPIPWESIRKTTNTTDAPKPIQNRNNMANRNTPHTKQRKQSRTNMERNTKIRQRNGPGRTGTINKQRNKNKTNKQEHTNNENRNRDKRSRPNTNINQQNTPTKRISLVQNKQENKQTANEEKELAERQKYSYRNQNLTLQT